MSKKPPENQELALFFTYGIGVADWDKNGSLSREIDIYKQELSSFKKIYWITYGEQDTKYQ